VPVAVSGWYLLLAGWTSWSAAGGAPPGLELTYGLLWASILTFSLLVHEFGHAFAARHYGLRPQVLLHGWGGLCAHDRAKRDFHDVVIISAGPGVELVLGIGCWIAWLVLKVAAPEVAANPAVSVAFDYLIFINIFWALVNLVPLWPLDGGQLFRLLLLRILGPAKGEKATHGVGVGIGVLAALAFVSLNAWLAAIIFGMLAWSNFQQMRRGGGSGPVRRTNKLAPELWKQAQAALAADNYAEASRLGHQIRGEANVPDALMNNVWALLTVATTRMGDFETALSYAQRSPRTSPVVRATIESLAGTGQVAEARELLAQDSEKLAPEDRAALEALLAP
jgi:stage IV sporulation protein FB